MKTTLGKHMYPGKFLSRVHGYITFLHAPINYFPTILVIVSKILILITVDICTQSGGA